MAVTFVVGARGYIGRRILYEANLVGRAIGTSSSRVPGMVQLDLDALEEFDYKVIKRGDIVILTSAISAPDICANEKERAWKINVTGTGEFISAVITLGAKVIFYSSDTVYGESQDEFDENHICAPAGAYAEMKHAIEVRFADNPSFKSVRLSYVFSRDDKFTRYLKNCSESAIDAEIFHPFFRAIVDRKDVVAATLALARRWDEFPDRTVNLGGPQVLSRVDFAEALRQVYLPNLCFTVIAPDSTFFNNRPRIIAMKSPILARLLGRSPRSLVEAACLEFFPTDDMETSS